ncbi:hypothetical protein [Sinanaerobacter sp. ZZT-01]|uniref:hypothetical protein n=1 Tax=Sinanaerobacter sp. ZZT-01 TaxID=3111540 RepID=UPI002D76FD2D|nr:hypothetical protein [Sinanaerobacter sp. ZZT-01]WRR94533.1 hypothetical protein U5921_05295 [Sinanaerobacter sp. ZZT-01]
MKNSRDFNRNTFDSFCDDPCAGQAPTCGERRPVEGYSCINSMKEVLEAIIYAVNRIDIPGFSVAIEITMKNGVIYTVNIDSGTLYPARIRGNLFVTEDIAISICDISKIQILSAQSDPTFVTILERALRRICYDGPCPPCPPYPPCPPCGPSSCQQYCGDQVITWEPPYQGPQEIECDSPSEKEECASDLQRFIRRNMDNIEEVAFNGGLNTIESISAISNITSVDVVEDASLTTTTTPVIQTAVLSQSAATVVDGVVPAAISVVTDVALVAISLVAGIGTLAAPVSAPITVTPVTVATSVNTADLPDGVVTGISVTAQTVVESLTTTAATVVNGFGAPTLYDGVVSVDAISTIGTTTTIIPTITAASTGLLQVVVPADAFGAGIPGAPVTLDILVGGATVTLGTPSTVYTLPTDVSLLAGATTATLVAFTVLGAPTATSVIETVVENPIGVAGALTTTTYQGDLIESANLAPINEVAVQPASVTALTGIGLVTELVNVVEDVVDTPASSLFTTTTESVVGAAALNTTTTNVVNSASLITTDVSVVESVDAETISVLSPTEEPIAGTVTQACDGIMTVENTNGNITVYSICEINSVTVD